MSLDLRTTSPLAILVVWAGLLFGLSVAAGAALGWLIGRRI